MASIALQRLSQLCGAEDALEIIQLANEEHENDVCPSQYQDR